MLARLSWLLLAFSSLAPLALARVLTPSSSGIGTHTQLGLPPCGFLQLFQLPCPACGLTTSFVLLAHGELALSLEAHPLGLPLALTLLALGLRACHGLMQPASPSLAWLLAPGGVRTALALTCALGLVWLGRLASALSR